MNIGARVRELRIAKGISLSELARRAGLSVSFLSHLERGEVNGSLNSLQSVAEALGTNLIELFSSIAPRSVTVMRKADRIKLRSEETGAEFAMLAAGSHPVVPCIARLEPGGRTSGTPRSHRRGYEFAFVLEGRVDYHIESQVYPLKKGDSLLFDATLNNVCVNSGDEPCTWLWVVIDTSARGQAENVE